jgi:hypothetical protein
MIINICILIFLAAMAYFWATWGWFSAMIHLACTITAAALTVALWEPLTVNFLLGRFPAFGWGVGLIAPFTLILIALRAGTWILVPGNVQHNSIADQALGGLCGLLSGILSAGILVIGLSLLPLDVSLAGYQPLSLDKDGQVVRTKGAGLWVEVDSMTVGFLERISGGAFAAGSPIREYQPDLVYQAALYRLKSDPNSSNSLVPESVEVPALFGMKLWDVNVDERAQVLIGERPKNLKLYIVDTKWSNSPGTYDIDGALRVHPSQIRLVAAMEGNPDGPIELLAPMAVSVGQPTMRDRQFTMLDKDSIVISGNAQTMKLGWMFLVDEKVKPLSVVMRKARFALPAITEKDDAAMIEAFGMVVPRAVGLDISAPAATPEPPTVGGRMGVAANAAAISVEVSDKLPRMLSKNASTGFTFEGNTVKSGRGNAPPLTPGSPVSIGADRLACPSHLAMVRVRMARDQAQSLLGAARASAAMLQPMQLKDHVGQQWMPTGWALRTENDTMEVRYEPEAPIRAVKELPVEQLNSPAAELYVYFPVQRGVKIVEFQIGNTTGQTTNIDVPK